MQQAMRGRILVGALTAALLWGGVFTALKLGLGDIPVLSFTAARLILASLLFLALSGGFGWLARARPVWRSLVSVGLAQTSFQILLLQGLALTSASTSAILLACSPLMTAAWLALVRRERMVGRQWLGMLLGVVGVALVMRADAGLSGSLIGNVVALGAAVAWAWYGLAIGPVARAVGPIRASTASIWVAALLLTLVGWTEMTTVNWAGVSMVGWLGFLYALIPGLVLATVLWVRSIQHWGTQPTMSYGYVEPVAAVVIAALVLGEALQPIQGVGAVLALVGVYLATEPV